MGTLAEARASHAGPAYQPRIDRCRAAVLGGAGLDLVAHYTGGVLDFAVDTLASAGVTDLASLRDDYRRVGATLDYRMKELNRRLRQSRSGLLVRTVLQTERGAAFCHPVVPGQYVVAFTSGPRLFEVRRADRAGSALAADLRSLISRSAPNPDGWLTAPGDGSERGEPRPASPAAPFRPRLDGSADRSLARAVTPLDLHYAARYRAGRRIGSADVLDHAALAAFFDRDSTPADRRSSYEDLGVELSNLSIQLGRDVFPVIDGPVMRMMLVVEQGAIFQYRLSDDEHLIGVTLDPSRVEATGDLLSELSDDAVP